MKSIVEDTGLVATMPEFKQRLLYMHKSDIRKLVLPAEYSDFTDTIGSILERLNNQDGPAFITIDEKIVSGETHRRPGIHVDFNWVEDLKAHGGGGGGHSGGGGGHSGGPGWTRSGHQRHLNVHGGMLLASNHVGCKGYDGEFEGEIADGGDCAGIDVSGLKAITMEPGRVYYLNATGIHEPLVIEGTVKRTLIRINFHHEYRWKGAA